MQINQELINKWFDVKQSRIREFYESNPERKPPEYASNLEAIQAIRVAANKKLKENQLSGQKSKKLGAGDAAEIIVKNAAVVFIDSKGEHSLATYDYDKKMYTFNTMTILNDYIVQIMGVSSQSIISSVVTTLSGLRHNGVLYNPLPKYKIAVGNGIYNCLTQELEPFTPYYTVLTKISTNYIENAERPQYADGFTLESMIASLANNDPNRIALIGQICKAILTEHSLKPGLFIILGSGGDGKSTFFTMLSNIIGQENTAYVNFGELESPDKMAETINKKLVLGLDNDVKVYLRKTAMLKSIASHETITFSRKYMNAISVPFTGTFVQLCNEMPRMAESGSSMRRRLVSFKAENSHYETGTENDNIDTVYIKDKRFLEYALWYFLNESTNPYYADFNDVDRSLVNDSLDAEDILSQYLNELAQIGVISEFNKYLPSSHLYAGYQDWMNVNNPGSKMLSARSFALQIGPKLNNYGYIPSNQSNIRPNALEKNKLYIASTWGDYAERPNLEQSLKLNTPSKIFVKSHEGKSISEIRRRSTQVSPYIYFNIAAQINSDLTQEEINSCLSESSQNISSVPIQTQTLSELSSLHQNDNSAYNEDLIQDNNVIDEESSILLDNNNDDSDNDNDNNNDNDNDIDNNSDNDNDNVNDNNKITDNLSSDDVLQELSSREETLANITQIMPKIPDFNIGYALRQNETDNIKIAYDYCLNMKEIVDEYYDDLKPEFKLMITQRADKLMAQLRPLLFGTDALDFDRALITLISSSQMDNNRKDIFNVLYRIIKTYDISQENISVTEDDLVDDIKPYGHNEHK